MIEEIQALWIGAFQKIKKQDIIFALGIIAILFWRPGNTKILSVWLERWDIVLIISTIVLLYHTRLGAIPKIFCAYLLLQGLVVRAPIPELFTQIRNSTQSHLLSLLCLIVFVHLRIDIRRLLFVAAIIVTVGISLSTSPNLYTGMIWNPSMAATFVVLASYTAPWSIIAVILTKSWTAFFALAVGLLWRYKRLIPWGWVIPISIVTIFVTMQSVSIPDNGRFIVWRQVFDFWLKGDIYTLIFGWGPGAGRVWIPYVNMQYPNANNTVDVRVWLHNDWLQALMEYGIIGMGLALAAFYSIFKRLDDRARSVALAFGAAMITNFPTHIALHALVGWSLIQRSGNPKTEQTFHQKEHLP